MTDTQQLSKKEFEIFHQILDMSVQKNRALKTPIRMDKIKNDVLSFAKENEIQISSTDVEKHLRNYLNLASVSKKELTTENFEALLVPKKTIEQMVLKNLTLLEEQYENRSKGMLNKIKGYFLGKKALSETFIKTRRILFHSHSYFNEKNTYGFEKTLLYLYSLANNHSMAQSIKSKELLNSLKFIYTTPIPFASILFYFVVLSFSIPTYIAALFVIIGFLTPAIAIMLISHFKKQKFDSELPEKKLLLWSEGAGFYHGELKFNNKIIEALELESINQVELIPNLPLVQMYITMISEDAIGGKILDNYLKNKGGLRLFDLKFFDLAFPEFREKILNLKEKKVQQYYCSNTKTYHSKPSFVESLFTKTTSFSKY